MKLLQLLSGIEAEVMLNYMHTIIQFCFLKDEQGVLIHAEQINNGKNIAD